jgi:DNA helicase IV
MGDRADVIAEEQKAVDHAYSCYEQRFARNRGLKQRSWDATDTAAGTSFIPETPSEIKYDDDLDGQALVFRRVDAVEDGAEVRRTYYIGRRAVLDYSGEVVVVSWQAPAVKEWMRAKLSAPGEVRLRRALSCDRRTVRDYSDEFVVDEEPTASGTRPAVAGQGPERLRDFLLEDLDRARDGTMRDIVETIRQDQFELVSDERQGVLVVQGGPGTGKTAVGLHRVSWLLYNEIFKSDEVLIVGPHRGFFDYVSRVIPALDIRGALRVELDLLWADSAHGRRTDTVGAARIKSGGRMATVLRRAVDDLVRPEALTRWAQGDQFRLSFEGVGLAVPSGEIASLAEVPDAELTYQVRRRRFSDALVDRLMHAYAVARPRRANDVSVRSRLGSHPGVAGLTRSMWPQLTAENVLRNLFDDPKALRTAAAGILDDEEQKALLRPQAERVSEERWSIADQVCLEELRFLMGVEGRPPRYRHIVVDEAQDLTPMQARSLARRCPSGSMTVLGDLAQSTGSHAYDRWDELAEILAGPEGWHLEELTVGYRLPDDVMRLAAPLAAEIAPSVAFPTSVRPAGDTALSILRISPSELVDVAASKAVGLADAEAGSGRSTALILPGRGRLLQEAKSRVAALREGKQHGGALHVLTSAQTKGLEFDHVIVVEPAAIVREPAGLRWLYIAVTRCTRSLTVVHGEPLPEILVGAAEPDRGQAVTVDPIHDVPLTDGEHGAESANAVEEFVSALEGRVGVDRECHVHERIRYLLIGELHGARLTPETNLPTIDIACDGPAGTVLYEVLGEGGHTYERMREGVLRIIEVQYAEGESADHRFLVLPRQPAETWAAETVREAFGVSVIWRTADGWEGHHVSLALGRETSETS